MDMLRHMFVMSMDIHLTSLLIICINQVPPLPRSYIKFLAQYRRQTVATAGRAGKIKRPPIKKLAAPAAAQLGFARLQYAGCAPSHKVPLAITSKYIWIDSPIKPDSSPTTRLIAATWPFSFGQLHRQYG
jgi:hypothetical protein